MASDAMLGCSLAQSAAAFFVVDGGGADAPVARAGFQSSTVVLPVIMV